MRRSVGGHAQPAPTFQTEWHRFDLLIQQGRQATVIEFKYYLQRRTLGLLGEDLGFKGGPGPKNEAEFKACVDKLRTAALPGVDDRRLVLVYEKQSHSGFRYSFNGSYQDLAAGDDLVDVQKLTVDQLEARVLRPRLGLATGDETVRYPV